MARPKGVKNKPKIAPTAGRKLELIGGSRPETPTEQAWLKQFLGQPLRAQVQIECDLERRPRHRSSGSSSRSTGPMFHIYGTRVTTCPKCGKATDKCAYCGAALEPPPEPPKRKPPPAADQSADPSLWRGGPRRKSSGPPKSERALEQERLRRKLNDQLAELNCELAETEKGPPWRCR